MGIISIIIIKPSPIFSRVSEVLQSNQKTD